MPKELAKQYAPQGTEDRIYQNWCDKGYFHTQVDRSKKPFTIVMPPPNVTGQLHMGHAMDETWQDILTRYKRMQGYAALSPLPHTDDLSQFGLSDTKRYISLTDTEGNTRTYWLGTQTDEGQYIQPEDETDAVYLSPAGVDGTLNMGIYDMARLPKLPQLTADNVSALTVTAADGKSLSLTASEGVWLRSGQNVTQWSGTLTEALGQLTLLRCIDYRPSTGVAELCGLTEPAVTLTVTYRAIAGETELTLRVGAQRDGGYYATVNDDDTIYLLPAAPAEALAALAANGLNG